MATTPRQLPSGRWYVQVFLGKHPETGKTRWASKTFDRQKDAKDWTTKIEGQRNEGSYRPTTTGMTLAGYLVERWLPAYRTQVRGTYNIEKTLGKWVLRPREDTPFLGKLALTKLTVHDFDRLYLAMAQQGIGARGIQHLHAILKRALKWAVRKGELPRNPAEFATLPKPDVQAEIEDEHDEAEAEVRYLSREQAQRVLLVAKQDRLSALWHLLLDAGLRPGEAFALQWRHIDFGLALVKVRATLARVGVPKPKAGGRGWKITRPKTEASVGEVPISQATLAELRRWKRQQAEERLRMGSEWQDHGFVFTTELGTPLGNNMGRIWTRLLAEADGGKGDLGTWGPEPKKPTSGPMPQRSFRPRFVPYVLRHTCATLLLLDGVDLLTVSRRLRHKNISITARFYGHMAAKHTTAAAESFERLASAVGA